MNKPIHIRCSNQPDEDYYHKISCFKDFDDKDFSLIPYVLINIHLNWDEHLLSKDYGFDIAHKLRLEKKFLGAILFYSPLPYNVYVNKAKKDYKYKILFGRGSNYINLPTTQVLIDKFIANINPLSKAVLQDVNTMLCNLKGVVIDKIRHDLKIRSDAFNVITTACKYLTKSQAKGIKAEFYLFKFKDIKCDFNDLKEEFINRCERYLSLEEVSKTKKGHNKHTILIVDDEKNIIDVVQKQLGEKFNIIPFQEGQKAILELEKDIENNIVAVIADWRLYEVNQSEQWQSVQGYEILSYASKNGYRSLFALTSQSEFIVHLIRNEMGIGFYLFKKDDLKEKSGWSVISDVIQEKCDNVLDTISNIPSAKGWRKKRGNKTKVTFQELYYRELNSVNRVAFFKEIEDQSSEIWNYINDVYKKGNDFTDILIIPQKFGLTLSTTKPNVQPALTQRRIWYALWNFHPRKDALSNSELFDDIHRIIYRSGIREFNASKKSQDPNKIGITINDLSKNRMLPEEKSWLHTIYDLG